MTLSFLASCAPDVEECGEFEVCWPDAAHFDTKYAFVGDAAEIVIWLESSSTVDGISSVELRVPSGASRGDKLDVVGEVRQTAVDTIYRELTGGELKVLTFDEGAISVRVHNLQLAERSGGIFLMQEAELEIDCIGEHAGSQCGGTVRRDVCGVARTFRDGDCDG